MYLSISIGLPCCLSGKESTHNAGDVSSILGWKDPLEKEIATHSSILAWSIPRTEEPDGLQSMESKRVGHNRVTKPQKPSLEQTVSLTWSRTLSAVCPDISPGPEKCWAFIVLKKHLLLHQFSFPFSVLAWINFLEGGHLIYIFEG